MNENWSLVIDFLWLSLFIGIGVFFKRKVFFFQKFLFPTAIIAGFIGLLLGREALQLVDLDRERLGSLVYHLMAIGFISIALKKREHLRSRDIFNSGVYIVSIYVVQGIIGFIISLLLANTVFPDLFPSFGLLLPLGFGQGPGQAYAIGRQWEEVGFFQGGNIGLSIATIGFLWACIVGVILVNYLIKKGIFSINLDKYAVREKIHEEMDSGELPLAASLDDISIQLFLIGLIYLATYLTLLGLNRILLPLGTFGETLAQLLWGFHFIIGTIYAILLRVIFNQMKKMKIMNHEYPNSYMLQRIAGGCFDFMITAAIAAISIKTLHYYMIPTLLITTIGGIITIIFILWMTPRVFKSDILQNIIAFYGTYTGTISTGMALLKQVDPGFNSGASENIVLGSGIALIFGFPLMVMLNIPIFGYITKQPVMYFVALLSFLAYFGILCFILYKNRAK
ncbi:MAG: sodium:glutamate symporter [Atribacterota bacterium]|nr:sodium:glutamate symporter [Atribacterota bacterium]MDD5637435.1 sodium:glutamate symporter [Atribacterota bacterium]